MRGIKTRMQRLTPKKYPYQRISEERMKTMQDILFNQKILTVYCDFSGNNKTNYLGIAACFVGNGNTFVESTRIYGRNPKETALGEILAVFFAVKTLPVILERYRVFLNKPTKIYIYSDYVQIENIQSIDFKKQEYIKVTSELIANLNQLRERFNWCDISIKYLGEEKKQNIYHKAAHRASRKA